MHISSKKLYLDRRGACGGGLSVGIFFIFYFSVFEFFFLTFFMFWKNNL